MLCVDDLERILFDLIDEFQRENYNESDIRVFIETLSIYHFENENLSQAVNTLNEFEVYNFNVHEFLNENL